MGQLGAVPINNFLGTQTSPPVSVPAGATFVTAEFDGATMTDPAQHVVLAIDFAPDGVTWREITRSSFQSGGHNRQGQPLASYPVSADVPAEGSNRKLRATLTVSDVPLTTTVRISTQ